MTEMGRQGWSNPEKAKAMLSRIPLGRFAGETPRRERMDRDGQSEAKRGRTAKHRTTISRGVYCNSTLYMHWSNWAPYMYACRGGGRGEQYFIPAEWQKRHDSWSYSSGGWRLPGLLTSINRIFAHYLSAQRDNNSVPSPHLRDKFWSFLLKRNLCPTCLTSGFHLYFAFSSFSFITHHYFTEYTECAQGNKCCRPLRLLSSTSQVVE